MIWVLKQTVVNQKSSIEHQASIKVYKCRNNFSCKETENFVIKSNLGVVWEIIWAMPKRVDLPTHPIELVRFGTT